MADIDSTTIEVLAATDWVVGDELIIGATESE
jgi:hypothetical protein